MRSRGADRPDDDTGPREEQPGRSRRLFGRARVEPPAPEEVPQDETGWLDDLRSAKVERTSIGPGVTSGEVRTGEGAATPSSGGSRPVSPPPGGSRPVSPPSAAPRSVPPPAAPRPTSPPAVAPRSVSPPPRGSMPPPSGSPAAVTPASPSPSPRRRTPVDPASPAAAGSRFGMSGAGPRPASPPPAAPTSSRHAAPDEPGHGRRTIESGGTGQHSREFPRGLGADAVGQHSREFPRGLGADVTGQHSREIARPETMGQHSREIARPDTTGQHSREIPRPGPRDTATARAAVRPSGSGRPVSPTPGAEGTLFGSRNTTAGRARPGAAAPDGYPGGRRGTAGGATAGDGRRGPADLPGPADVSGPVDRRGPADRPRPADAAGRQPPAPGRNRPGQWSGMAPAVPVKAAAVVPPVVPGPSGVRTPAVPGRAGAMADSPSGVIQRPGSTTGNITDRTTGRVPRAGRPAPRPADTATGGARRAAPADTGTGMTRRAEPATTGTGAMRAAPADTGTGGVRRAAPDRATGRVTGAVPAPGVAVPLEVPDGRPRTEGRPGTGPVTATARAATTAIVDRPAEEPVGATELPRTGSPGLRERLRTERGLRVVALVTLSVVVLLLLPLAFGVRAATRDPVLRSLDALNVPGWAARDVEDRSSGSRWCFLDCRFRERTAQSDRPFVDTQKTYAAALVAAGWRPWNVSGCPDQPISPRDGRYSCWRRDEFTLDLWVRLPECAVDAVAAQDPAALPSTGPDGVVPTTTDPKKCTGSTVSIKVQNAITDQRGQPGAEKPGLTGETPDPVLSNDPLLEPTPVPS